MYEIYLKLLREKGLRASDVSKATGIPPSTFTDWKTGRSKPKQEKLEKLAEFFEVSVDYLLGRKSLEEGLPAIEEDDDIAMLNRVGGKLSPEQRKKAISVLKAMFDELDWEE